MSREPNGQRQEKSFNAERTEGRAQRRKTHLGGRARAAWGIRVLELVERVRAGLSQVRRASQALRGRAGEGMV
jgi:hypothetical protein